MPGRPAAGISTADLGRAHRKPRRPVSAARDLLTLLFWLSSATCWRNPRKFSRRLRYDVSCGARLSCAAGFREFCKRARGGWAWLRGVGGCSVIYELLGRLSGWWMELGINVYVFFFFFSLSSFFFEILGVAVNWILFIYIFLSFWSFNAGTMKREFLKQTTVRSMKDVDTPGDTKGNYIGLVIRVRTSTRSWEIKKVQQRIERT